MNRLYYIRPAIISPILCAGIAIMAAFYWSPWSLSALPFIYLGSICSAPNLNLADGFLVLVSCIIGGAACRLHLDIGLAIALGALGGWLLGAIEKNITARPAK